MTKDEALQMAIEVLDLNVDCVSESKWKEAINACKKALEQPAQELEAYLRSAIDNARDVCKYLDHDMVEKAKANTQFFWDDLDKIRELDNDLGKIL